MTHLLKRSLMWLYARAVGSPRDSWFEHRAYTAIHPSVILGAGSTVDVKFRPDHPGVCVDIGEDSQIFGHLVVQRPGARIRIGQRTQIGASLLVAANEITICDDVLMAWGVTVVDNDSHSANWEARQHDVRQSAVDYRKTPDDIARNKDWSTVPMAPVRVGAKAWIGFGVTILKGVTIGEGAVIGAGSVVTGDIPPLTLAAGNPARPIRSVE